jgi:two-component system cell cycle sensor histidine kinase/response regulator CckA
MTADTRSTLFRYGLALAIFAGIVVIALLLIRFSIQLNITILVAVGLAVAAWFGGRGPGFLLVGLVVAFAVVTNRANPSGSLASLIFGYVSVAALLAALVWLISGRRITEERLREQSELLRITLASIGDGVIATNQQGTVTFVNETAASMMSCTAEDPVGKPLDDVFKVIDEAKGEQVENIFGRIKDRREVVTFASDVSLDCGPDRRVPILDSGAPIIGQDGKFLGAVIVFQDDRPRREAEREAKETEARRQLSQKLEAVGRLTGGIAHDFNNLLTSMIGYTELAMHKVPVDDKAYEYLVNVERGGAKAAELTKKLLAFSRQQKLETRTIDLNASIAEILRLLERVIGADIEVTFNAASDLHPVAADSTQIEQVIMNLSINARDAMPGGGKLALETRNVELDEHFCRQYPECEPGPYVQILVSDTGHGMDAPTLNRVFEPFFTTKAAGAGTGLGLSTAYGIIRQHGGQISAYSEPERGTTFKVFLPAALTGEARGLAKNGARSLKGGNETILLADDEEVLRELSREVLESLGYTVITAADGTEALRLYADRKDDVDLLLLDVVMPSLGGVETYRAVRHDGTEPPVIFMTGYSSEMVGETENISGVNFDLIPVIQKPYTLEALGKIVRETLDLPANRE